MHRQLLKLGFDVSESIVSCYLQRISRGSNTGKLWAAFLRNHRELHEAMDIFTAPIVTFRVLNCFFVIEHGRRRILHCHVTEHPTGPWIVKQVSQAFPESSRYRSMILDRDSKCGKDVTDMLNAGGLKPKRTSLAIA
jgi:hypothetical protein